MTEEQNGALIRQRTLEQGADESIPGIGIQGRRRLISNDDRRRINQGSGYCHTLLLTHAQAGGFLTGTGAGQAKLVNQFHYAAVNMPTRVSCGSAAVECQTKPDIVSNTQVGQQIELLEDDTCVTSAEAVPRPRAELADVGTVYDDMTFIGFGNSAEKI